MGENRMRAGRGSAALAAALSRRGLAWALACAVVFACALALFPARALATVSVDVAAPSTIVFENVKAPGQMFTAYRVAAMATDGTLAAVDALAPAVGETGLDPAHLAADTDAATLRTYAQSYVGYVAANAAGFASASAQETGGTATIAGLEPGAYLVVASTVTTEDTVYASDPYLVVVPVAQSDGSCVYTRTVEADKVTQTHARTFENRVVKLWADDDAASRPTSVTVQIFNGDELYREVELSSDNAWSFAWEGAGDWSVREIADEAPGYTATVAASAEDDVQNATFSRMFQVTNRYAPAENEGAGSARAQARSAAPRTGDQVAGVLPIVLGVAGVALVAAGVAARKARR